MRQREPTNISSAADWDVVVVSFMARIVARVSYRRNWN
jgi:hypothetical protein